jgi:hypothetical protein
MKPYALWFRWAVFLGILQDFVVGIPGIFFPNGVLDYAGLPPAPDPVWPAFACLILVLLGTFYIPGAIDPFGYRPLAILTVVARAAGVVFFFVLYRGQFPDWFGYVDLFLTVLQGGLLFLTFRAGPESVPPTGAVEHAVIHR